jgi:hypothetical protein
MIDRSRVSSRRAWLIGALLALLALEALLFWLSPAEQTLGQVVKMVYLHGALIRVSLIGFAIAGLLGALWMIVRRAELMRWLISLQRTLVGVWLVYAASSVVVTYLAWGVAIAWGEPRVMATIRVTIAVLAIFLVTEIAGLPALTAIANAMLALVALFATQSAGVINHPIDPIGGSSSVAIRVFYAGIVIVMLAIVTDIVALVRYSARPSAGED